MGHAGLLTGGLAFCFILILQPFDALIAQLGSLVTDGSTRMMYEDEGARLERIRVVGGREGKMIGSKRIGSAV